MLKKIISGGQIGADVAGLRAAKVYNIKTGGHIPKGFLTRNGKHPEYAEMYGLEETDTNRYPPRTALNVQNSDATLQLASDFQSPGEKLTTKLCIRHNKPVFGVRFMSGEPLCKPRDVADWIKRNNVKTLNIAGNANKELEDPIEDFLKEVFQLVKS